MRERSHAASRVLIVATAALSALFAGLSFVPGFAQEPAGSSEPPRFVLGTVSTDPGTTASIPVFYKPGAGQPIRNLHLEVEFVRDNVQFIGAQKGPAAKIQDFDLAVETKELFPDDRSVEHGRLTIDVSVVDPDTKESLPEGLLASLDFKVPPDALVGSVRLVPITVSARDGSNNPAKVIAEEGTIIIVSTPTLACFFYMH